MSPTLNRTCLVLAFGLSGSFFPTAHAGEPRKVEVVFVAGYGAGSRISNDTWQAGRRKAFQGQSVRFFDNPRDQLQLIVNREQMKKIIQQADILFYSGHTVTPRPPAPTHALKLRAVGNDNGALTTADIRAALEGKRGPRVVLLNGCKTTNPGDGVAAENRINNGFGITDGTQGRVYLGWTEEVVGFNGDDQMTTLLTHWTTPNAQGVYPTIGDSLATLNNPTITLIGDRGVRYDVRALVR